MFIISCIFLFFNLTHEIPPGIYSPLGHDFAQVALIELKGIAFREQYDVRQF